MVVGQTVTMVARIGALVVVIQTVMMVARIGALVVVIQTAMMVVVMGVPLNVLSAHLHAVRHHAGETALMTVLVTVVENALQHVELVDVNMIVMPVIVQIADVQIGVPLYVVEVAIILVKVTVVLTTVVWHVIQHVVLHAIAQ